MKIGFDLISDLNLAPDDSFNWENKATSLYCIVAGNVSSDLRTVAQTLTHLSKFYQGVFYAIGALEYQGVENIEKRTKEILRICSKIRNVAVLHHHVVIIDGIAILGCNGWYGNTQPPEELIPQIDAHRIDDIHYLKNSIEKLQKHLDVTKILLVSNSVPGPDLYFGEEPDDVKGLIPINLTLLADTQDKVTHWAFGTHKKIVDSHINGINYINNPYYKRNPYWAKRIEVEV